MLHAFQNRNVSLRFFLFFSAPNTFYKKEKNISVLLSARKLAEKAFPKTKEAIVLSLQFVVEVVHTTFLNTPSAFASGISARATHA